MKTKILLSALLLTSTLTFPATAMDKEEKKAQIDVNKDIEQKEKVTTTEESFNPPWLHSKVKDKKDYVQTNKEIKEGLDTLAPLKQAEKLYTILKEMQLAVHNKPLLMESDNGRFRAYSDWARRKLVELSVKDQLTKEEEQLFKSALILADRSTFAGVAHLNLMGSVGDRARQLLPKIRTKGPAFPQENSIPNYKEVEEYYTKTYGVKKLFLSEWERQWINKFPWKPMKDGEYEDPVFEEKVLIKLEKPEPSQEIPSTKKESKESSMVDDLSKQLKKVEEEELWLTQKLKEIQLKKTELLKKQQKK